MVSLVLEKRKLLVLGVVLVFFIGGFWLCVQIGCSPGKEQEGGCQITSPPLEVEVTQPRVTSGRSHILSDPGKQEFFVECRLTRDRIRSQQVELLKEIANNPTSSSETRDRAQKDLLKIAENMGKEAELEKLIMAWGFKDAIILIQPKSATVIVQARVLSPSEVEKIKVLVIKAFDLETENIVIIPKT